MQVAKNPGLVCLHALLIHNQHLVEFLNLQVEMQN